MSVHGKEDGSAVMRLGVSRDLASLLMQDLRTTTEQRQYPLHVSLSGQLQFMYCPKGLRSRDMPTDCPWG